MPTEDVQVSWNALEFNLLNSGTLWPNRTLGFDRHYWFHANDTIGKMIYSGSVWLAGKAPDGSIMAAANYYSNDLGDFYPGPMGATGPPDGQHCEGWDKVFHVTRLQVQAHKQLADQYATAQGGTIPSHLIHGNIRNWPGAGNPYFTDAMGALFPLDTSKSWAPFFDADGDGIYDPAKGDHPAIKGDLNFWWIFNDAGGSHHVTKGPPMGIETSVLVSLFDTGGHAGNASYYELTVNSPFSSYDSFYFGLYVDFDIGYGFDDYLSCDTSRHMGIGLNGANADGVFGNNPPQFGVRFLETPKDSNGKMYGMSAFRKFIGDTGAKDPPHQNPTEFWNYLQGRWRFGEPQKYGGDGYYSTGPPFPWIYPSDPEDTTGWSQCALGRSPFDQRFLMTSGPYHLESGKPLSFTFAVISAACTGTWDGKCHRRHCIQQASDEVHDFFKAQRPVGIDLPQQPLPRQLKIFPNPASGQFSLSMSEGFSRGVVSVDLFDIRGAMVRQWLSPAPEAQFPLIGLPHGPYFVAVRFSTGERVTGVLVVSGAD